ncbi:MAG TPA: nickel-dependent hydrogenase large subunit, partial [Thermoguttaceae bacterium]|nr:nickel-dependent hydrogenase large subunit [Thermoguttaceae bacterium]
EVDGFLSSVGLPIEKVFSVLGRHAARALETLWVAKQTRLWLDEVEIGGPPAADFQIPEQATGFGLTEAPRGALGHWLSIEDYRISRYQCIVPTTWNCSPRDDSDRPGAVEQALAGTRVDNPDQPIEVGRIVRSFDPCIACAVH